ncbi:MAG: hypothetical protein Fur0025_26370 [Oscillatoriaceae cyanobacterium]
MAGAQVVPDRTLPIPSQVQQNHTTNIITGGTTAGGNLFHSFQEFSLPTGSSAYFNNYPDIENIITRVTGGKISQIDGLIKANGGANLFLINPSGIIFGANARLNIGGSFLGTTADSIVFPNGIYFSATKSTNEGNHETVPLLSVNVPVGLQFGADAAPIKVHGLGATRPDSSIVSLDSEAILAKLPELVQGEINFQDSFLDSPEGLRVEPGKTLALVGGDINVTGGLLKARSGEIDLGSVAPGSFVSFIPTDVGFTLGYEGVNTYKDIEISQKSWLITSGNGAGDIQLTGRRLSFLTASQIDASALGEAPGGQVIITASEAVEMREPLGGEFTTIIGASAFSRGNAGDVIIKTRQLKVWDGSVIAVQTFDIGNGGNIMLNASESVAVSGTSPNGKFPSIIGARSLAAGNGGSVQIDTGKINITDGGLIGVETLDTGNAGTIYLTATESVELRGGAANNDFFSWIAAGTSGAGNGGNILVETPRFIMQDGAAVSIGTDGTGHAGSLKITGAKEVLVEGQIDNEMLLSGVVASANDVGNGGNIAIETERFIVKNGGVVAVGTTGAGNAGNIDIRAAEAVEISGGDGDNASVLGAETIGAGDAGNVTIVTKFLRVADGAVINVNGTATGNPGNIEVTANSLSLENQAGMLATSATGRGGNINLQVRDVRLRFGSEISAAGSSIGNITLEGNINLQAETLVLLENSRIITSASNPSGGSNIAITPLNGEQLLVFQSPDSVINARGELTIAQNFVVQPVAIPLVKLVNVEGLMSRNFCQRGKDSQFIMTGRGGLPPTPFEAMTSEAAMVEWARERESARPIGGNPVSVNQGKFRVNP